MGRQTKYSCDEDRKEAIKQSNRDYSLAGKWSHLKTLKHNTNALIYLIKDRPEIMNHLIFL